MAKVLICYQPGSDVPHACYYGGDTYGRAITGENVEYELRRAAEAHHRQGHTTFLIEHDAPHTLHYGEMVEHIARHKGAA